MGNSPEHGAGVKAIVAKNVVKAYSHGRKKTEILHGLSLEVAAGEFVAITGPSGAGKSTLLRLLGGLDAPTSGTIELFGSDSGKLSDRKLSQLRNKSIGFVFQDYRLIPHYSALQNVMVPLKIAGLPGRKQRAKAHEILRIVGLEKYADSRVDELSGGQQQRVGIARAICLGPKLLIADEPTGNLDSKTSESILSILSVIHKKMGTTIVMVTHNDDIAARAERQVHLRDGKILQGASRL